MSRPSAIPKESGAAKQWHVYFRFLVFIELRICLVATPMTRSRLGKRQSLSEPNKPKEQTTRSEHHVAFPSPQKEATKINQLVATNKHKTKLNATDATNNCKQRSVLKN